jgi:hypothetical protein
MMPTPFVLNDSGHQAKIIPGQITRAPIPIVTQNQPLLKPCNSPKKGDRQYQVSKIWKAANNPKEQRRIIIANDRVKTQWILS